jgi:streptogramin lyase
VEVLEARCLPATVTEFGTGTAANSAPTDITVGADGNLWFTESSNNALGRITPDGGVTEFPLTALQTSNGPAGITSGPGGLLYFTEGNVGRIGRIDPLAGSDDAILASLTQSAALPSGAGAALNGITEGPDDNLWFTEPGSGNMGNVTPDLATLQEFPTPTSASHPAGIAVGPDSALWFTDAVNDTIGRITTAGSVTNVFPLQTSRAPEGITTGPDGDLWFAEFTGNQIGRITPAGTLTEFTLPNPNSGPQAITAGPDGDLWFTEQTAARVGLITTDGVVTEYSTGITAGSGPQGIVTGPDGNVWFTETDGNQIGRLVPDDARQPSSTVLSTSPASAANFGQSVTLTAAVTPASTGIEPTGTVSFHDGFVALGTVALADAGGTATAALTLVPTGGSHGYRATYNPGTDPNYLASTDAVSYSVTPAVTTTTITSASPASPTAFGQPVTFRVTVTPTLGGVEPTGTVNFYDAGVFLGSAPLEDAGGTATASMTTTAGQLRVGVHDITAYYDPSGDPNYQPSTSADIGYTVGKAPTTTTVTAASPSSFGQAVTFTATVLPAVDVTLPSGTVTFEDGSTVLGQGSLFSTGGLATATLITGPTDLALGLHHIVALYPATDDANFQGSTSAPLDVTIGPAGVTVMLSTTAASAVFGAPVITATVVPDSPALQNPPGQVRFTVTGSSGTQTFLAPVVNETATLGSPLDTGSYTITATYLPTDPNFSTATSPPLSQTITPASTSLVLGVSPPSGAATFGEPVTLTATVTTNSPGSGTPSGDVTFTVDDTPVTVPLDATGLATLTTVLAGGVDTISATYDPGTDSDHQASSSNPLSYAVQQAASTTTITSATPASSIFGEPVTITATVTPTVGAVEPTGSVTFLDAGVFVGQASLADAGGVATATFTTAPDQLSAGAHALTASYAGDSNFTGGSSATLSYTVGVNDTVAPAITSPGSTTFTVGTAGSFTVTASGSPAPVLSESGSDTLPVGVSFDPATGVLGGTPAFGSAGVYALHFTAHNGVGSDAAQTFTLTVNAANPAATATSAAPATAPFDAAAQAVGLSAAVTSAGGTVNEGTVTFTVLSDTTVIGNPATVNVVAGAAAAGYTLPAGTPAGTYTIQSVYNGTANFQGSSDSTQTLTVNPPSASGGTLQFSAPAYSVNENGGSALITLTRAGGSSGAVTVLLSTSDGSATAGQDYTAVSQTVSWGDGDTGPKTLLVPVLDQGLTSGQRTVNLTLTDPAGGATLGTPSGAVLTIADNDPPQNNPGTLQFTASTYNAAENGGSVTITVTRSGGSSGAVSVQFTTTDNTGIAGQDYTATTQTLSWADGDTSSRTVTVPILDAHLLGGQRLVNLALSAPTGGTALGSPNAAVLVIADNDAPSSGPPTGGSTSGGSTTGGSSGSSNGAGPVQAIVVVNAGKLKGLARASQRLTLTNRSGKELKGPLRVVLVGLSKKVKLRNASGVSSSGSPFVDLTADMAPSGSVNMTLQFSNPQLKHIKFTMEVIALGGIG